MAVTSIWRIKGAVGKVILYVENEDKTLSKEIIKADQKQLEPNETLETIFNKFM